MVQLQINNSVAKRVGALMACGVVTAAVLTGCASKPTHNSTMQNKAGMKNANHPPIVTNSRGVPNRYMVKQGDTVSKIAERYGLDWRTIGRMNNLNSQYTIYTGQWLTLWEGSGNAKANTPSKATPKPASPTPAPKPVVVQQTVATPSPTPAYTPPATTPSNAPLSIGSAGVMQFRYPVGSGNPVARRFGTTNIGGQSVTSQGMWFSGRGGDAVLASRAGTVLHADDNIDGAMIAIAHTDGFVSNYFHVQDAQVKSGQTVQAGQRIASMRQQPDGSGLLEFRISRNSNYIDPLSVLK
ncbi:MAG: M23 family metallopeptidase [Moraxella sp.]|nr:M23 family metallopeptidase [Moraxella sp.]